MTELEKRGRGLKQLMARQQNRVSLLPTASYLRAKENMDMDVLEPNVRILRNPIPTECFN